MNVFFIHPNYVYCSNLVQTIASLSACFPFPLRLIKTGTAKKKVGNLFQDPLLRSTLLIFSTPEKRNVDRKERGKMSCSFFLYQSVLPFESSGPFSFSFPLSFPPPSIRRPFCEKGLGKPLFLDLAASAF